MPDLPTIERLLTHPDYFGLETATPVQRAICRIADGRSLGSLAQNPLVAAALARDTPIDVWRALCWGSDAEREKAARSVDWSAVEAWQRLDRKRPGSVFVVSAVRCAKTLISSAATWRNACLADLSVATTPGELPRASFVSLNTDLAKVAFQKLVSAFQSGPNLSPAMTTTPTNNRVILKRPDGAYVEARVVAANNAGASLSARWLASVVIDEAPKMGGSECDVDFNALVAVSQERLLPGVQLFAIGSPWAAIGPVYEQVRRSAGKPSTDCVVIVAPGPAMNPVYWSRERCEALERRGRETQTSAMVDASLWSRFIADADVVLIPSAHVDAARRESPEVLEPRGWPAVAAIDPAARTNAWTLVVLVREPRTQRLRVAVARQWRGSTEAPLDTGATMREVAAVCRAYGVGLVYSDQWSGDALRELARQSGLDLVVASSRGRWEMYDAVRVALLPAARKLELPPAHDVADDLKRIRRVLTREGVTAVLPTTPDGRHCDYAPAVALALAHPPPEVPTVEPVADCPDDRPEPPGDWLDQGLDFDALDRREGLVAWRSSVMRG